MSGNSPLTVLKKAWLPLLIVVVVVIAGMTVSRVRTFFGAEGVERVAVGAVDGRAC